MLKIKLVSKGYFDDVITAMNEIGLSLLSQVAMDTNDFKYHVGANYARDTRLFFHRSGSNCFIVLSFNELEWDDGSIHQHWHIMINVELKEVPFVPMDFDEISLDEEGDEPEEDGEDPKCPGFYHAGWSMHHGMTHTWNLEQSDSYTRENVLEPLQLAKSVSGLLGSIGENLVKAPFKELQVTSWTPEYCFNGCGELFWERFRKSSMSICGNRRHFWTLVNNPWGSSGLKR